MLNEHVRDPSEGRSGTRCSPAASCDLTLPAGIDRVLDPSPADLCTEASKLDDLWVWRTARSGVGLDERELLNGRAANPHEGSGPAVIAVCREGRLGRGEAHPVVGLGDLPKGRGLFHARDSLAPRNVT